MSRTYPRASTVAAISLGLALVLPGGTAARAVFNSQPLQQQRFAVLAQPIGQSDWKLLVLEQIKTRPLCWTPRSDGLMDPTLNTFNFSGICSRYLDSNGYSLRSGGQDLNVRFRLRLKQRGNRLQLEAIDPDQLMPITVGTATVPRRDRNGFVKINLDDGWRLERRVYQGRTLSHVYFAHPDPINRLLAKAGNSSSGGFTRLGAPQAPGRPSRGPAPVRPRVASSGPIKLEVIPYRR